MQKQVKVMKRLSLVLFALMSVSIYAQCDFKTFLNTYFEIYEANDSLIELGVNVNGFEIASAITIQIPDLFIVSVEVSTDNTNWSTNATIAKYQKGTIDIKIGRTLEKN